ncbi:hypothetical protein Pse7367_0555 [Thalassoporum mexicanum PCC 7367]|nr:hypothetical protein Pse7367_0555 [Pseudanabaena sp. PCC 7367]
MAGIVSAIGVSVGSTHAQEAQEAQETQMPSQLVAQLPVVTRAIDNPFCPLPGQGFANQSLRRIAGYESQTYYVLICANSANQLYYYLANKTQGGTGNYVGFAMPSGNGGYIANNSPFAYAVDNAQIRISQNGTIYSEQVLATTAANPGLPTNPGVPIPETPTLPVAGRCPANAGSGVMIARYTTHNHDVYICRGRMGGSANPAQNYLVVAQGQSTRPLVLPAATTSNGYTANDGNIRHVVNRANYSVTVQGFELFTERVITCRGSAAGCGA